ncbi:fumarylacetoacetate hydrolase family protein [Nocardia sp. NPDC050712]|uniref:fumarylacetoacetate hydrolase family protein n=1 Tax=Nocardia sp. NPDC050712 TaxID=3155518 RepID=UPI0033D2C536
MRIVNADDRLSLVVADGILDVETASAGQFSPDIQAVYPRWAEFREWAASDPTGTVRPLPQDRTIGAPAPRPRQVFAIGLNYRDHAEESGMAIPAESMVVFTKFPSAITGPYTAIELPRGSVDFEAELVAVLGRDGHRVPAARAWDHVAGLTVGQDLSERELQLAPPSPQFSLGKSYPGFAPMGPALVTPEELADRDDLGIGCLLNGEQMQKSRTANMIFSIADIIAYLSAIVPLYAGDVIFTGTPAGVGWAQDPKRLLQPGDVLTTHIDGIGSMRHLLTAGTA